MFVGGVSARNNICRLRKGPNLQCSLSQGPLPERFSFGKGWSSGSLI